MSRTHVVQTAAAQAAASKLNMQSQAALIMRVHDAAKSKRDLIEADLRNQLSEISAKAEEALAKAQVLDDFEKGQLEEAFTRFLSTSGLQTVLDAISIQVDGKNYSITSVLNELLDSDAVADTEFSFDAVTGLLSAAKYTLQDGYIANMSYTSEIVKDDEGRDTNDLKFTGRCGNWRGLVVEESFTYRQVKSTVSIEGAPFDATIDNQLIKVTPIQFDITPFLQQSAPVVGAAPDLNGDGYIGTTPPATPPTTPPATDTGAGAGTDTGAGAGTDTGAGAGTDTGTGTGTGDTTPTEPTTP